MFIDAQPAVARKAFAKLCACVPSNTLREALIELTGTAEAFLTLRFSL
jgi:hypothetical protein